MHPLEDTVVVDSTQALIGPLTTQILGDLGAEVIKVERPGHGDLTRNFATEYNGLSAYFASLNRNKRSVTLNLTSADGKRVLKDLPLLSATADNLGLNTRRRTFRRDILGRAPASTPARRSRPLQVIRERFVRILLAVILRASAFFQFVYRQKRLVQATRHRRVA